MESFPRWYARRAFAHGFRVGVCVGVLLSGLAVAAAVVARASVGL